MPTGSPRACCGVFVARSCVSGHEEEPHLGFRGWPRRGRRAVAERGLGVGDDTGVRDVAGIFDALAQVTLLCKTPKPVQKTRLFA